MGRLSLRSFIRRQDIVYRVPGMAWDEALPLGDGCFGARAYQEGNAFLTKQPIYKDTYHRIVRQALGAHRNCDPHLWHKMAVPEVPVRYPTPRTAHGVPRESSVPGRRAEGGYMANPGYDQSSEVSLLSQ